MKFTLIVCTYKRRKALQNLLDSVKKQSLYPNEILIIDGSPDDETKYFLENAPYENLKYYKVTPENRGLTKQRNFGISKVNDDSEVVCFLDDDIVLDNNYFIEIINTYIYKPDAIGVCGYIKNNDAKWKKCVQNKYSNNKFYFDGWERNLSKRYLFRKKIGLFDNTPPGIMPKYSHGKAISFFPPSGNIYRTNFFSGGVASYRKEIFKSISFSEYFIGYGLYEDLDFTIRLSSLGNLYINTNATLYHFHDFSGRPNKYDYGKMVVRNGWYVWKIGVKKTSVSDRLKWHIIEFLLLLMLLFGIFKGKEKSNIMNEVRGRIVGWFSLFYNPPKIN